MHDTSLEERLRSVLRQEGDGLPFTITPDELERRLLLRRRARNGQRLSILAAGVAALAVGAIFAIGSGWFRGTNVATEPSPSPSVEALAALPATVGRTEVWRTDPELPGSDRSTIIDAPAISASVIATLYCTGDGSVTLTLNGETIRNICGTGGIVETEAWFTVVDGRAQGVMGTVETTGTLSFGLLIETPAAGEAAPSAVPTTRPEATPRVADALGEAGQAVLVTPIGADSRRPDSFDVTRLDPATNETVPIATIPGSLLPEDGWLDGGEGPPQVSATGWLAIPFTRGPNEDERGPAIAIVDLRAPDGAPWILDGYTSMSWDPTDKLVIERDGIVSIAWVTSRHVETPPLQDPTVRIAGNRTGMGMARGMAVAIQDGARFLATSEQLGAWGYVGFDGSFTATNDLPPVYQRTGLERPAGAGAHGLGLACDSGPDVAGSGCFLVESNEKHEPVETWLTLDSQPSLFDFAWAADGKSAWMLLDGRTTGGGQVASLAYAPDPGARSELARIAFDPGVRPMLLGIAGESTPGSTTVIAIGDDQGRLSAFVLDNRAVAGQDRTAWFAGWAADPPSYDPD